MVIESSKIVGGVAALAIVAGGLWASTMMLNSSDEQRGSVEVQQINEPSWAVEVKELGAVEVQKTAAR